MYREYFYRQTKHCKAGGIIRCFAETMSSTLGRAVGRQKLLCVELCQEWNRGRVYSMHGVNTMYEYKHCTGKSYE